MGILVADVADKGVGAALYMALCRTLIRTYAIEFDDEPHPELVLFAANGRILRDARANLFVTTFYSILDPKTGVLTYSNAGHNPPLLLKAQGEKSIYLLGQTGMPVGVEEEQVWGVETVQIQPGDVLILYTDGIPDALNPHGDFFQDKRLIEMALSSQGLTANEIQEVILKGLGQFVGNAPQFDDITLMVLVRDTL
jgi:sigma-B regulation protein RsbU (phosphoserine phosphatase)